MLHRAALRKKSYLSPLNLTKSSQEWDFSILPCNHWDFFFGLKFLASLITLLGMISICSLKHLPTYPLAEMNLAHITLPVLCTQTPASCCCYRTLNLLNCVLQDNWLYSQSVFVLVTADQLIDFYCFYIFFILYYFVQGISKQEII